MVDIYSERPSPFGYMNKNGTDSYGVCHNGFSTRDELDYQMARCNRENQLAQQCRNNGITEENYPQYGTSFWGNNSADNYGFGTSNISSNIENVTNRLNNSDALPKFAVVQNGNYPVVRDDKRGLFNTGVERFVRSAGSQNGRGIFNQVKGAASDLGKSYIDMINANYKSTPDMQEKGTTIDNFYHCVGNYNAASRGRAGSSTAELIGLGRELADYPKNVLLKDKSFSEANDDFHNDMAVNAEGRRMSGKYKSAFEACDKYRPEGYNPEEVLKYYKK